MITQISRTMGTLTRPRMGLTSLQDAPSELLGRTTRPAATEYPACGSASRPSPDRHAADGVVAAVRRADLRGRDLAGAVGPLQQVATGPHGPDRQPQRRQPAPQPQHVDVERVASGRAARPALAGKGVAGHD